MSNEVKISFVWEALEKKNFLFGTLNSSTSFSFFCQCYLQIQYQIMLIDIMLSKFELFQNQILYNHDQQLDIHMHVSFYHLID